MTHGHGRGCLSNESFSNRRGRFYWILCLSGVASKRGDTVIGIDNLNTYYDVQLKHDRLSQLENQPGFNFFRLDLIDQSALNNYFLGKNLLT